MSAQRNSGGTLIAVGAGFTVIILLVLQSLTGSGVFGTRVETKTLRVPEETTNAVRGNFAEHLLSLDSNNLSAVVGQYWENATITLTGQIEGWNGTYTGTANITRVMEGLLFGISPSGWGENFDSFMAGNVTALMVTMSNGTAIVNSTFGFSTHGIGGRISGTISAQDSYGYSGASSTWLISRETWNFTILNEQINFIV